MAKLSLNSALKGISGRIDNWVYRKYGDRTVLGRRPEFSGPPTVGQQAVRDRFRAAAAYAKTVLADPVQRVDYEALARARSFPLFALIMGDYLNPPEVTAIDLADYHGQVGNVIRVEALDDVAVQAIGLEIRDATDAILEQGPAVLSAGRWTYAATTVVPAGATVTIQATATDRPGHPGARIVAWTNA